MIANADKFIQEHNLTLPITPVDTEYKKIAQTKIDEIKNSLSTLDDKLKNLE